jgi:hypothetical protein
MGYDLELAGKHERDARKLQAALTDALVPLLKTWAETVGMHRLPESITAEVIVATGLCGGDSGHGGELAIRFNTNVNSNYIDLDLQPQPQKARFCEDDAYSGSIILGATGDWEQGGLVCALALLLSELLPIYTPEVPE